MQPHCIPSTAVICPAVVGNAFDRTVVGYEATVIVVADITVEHVVVNAYSTTLVIVVSDDEGSW